MKRFAAIVLFAGAVVLSTYILAPATPSAPIRVVPLSDLARADDQAAPIVNEMNAQVDRLKKRLAEPVSYPPPSRDPFRFGKVQEPPRSKPIVPALTEAAMPSPPPAPALPRLVAITSAVVNGTTVRTAVIGSGDDVQMVKVGETVSRLVITSIGTDVVQFTDPTTGTVFRISLQ